MSKTIVQDYGPIYGEPVNGTVQGRPNGSIFVPITNRISLSTTQEYIKRWTAGDGTKYYVICNSSGVLSSANYVYSIDALSQDLASYMVIDLYSDSDLTDKVATRTFVSGLFNITLNSLQSVDYDTPTAGDTLYLVATLCNNATPVAVSSVIELGLIS